MEELPKYDADMTAQLEKADAAGECLRFVGMSSMTALFSSKCSESISRSPLIEGQYRAKGRILQLANIDLHV